jgi:hypothetical protein
MPTSLPLTVGGIALHGFEVPDKHFIGPGGDQLVAVHRFPGGTKTVQSLGGFPGPISWSGIVIGPDAFTRTKQLDRLRVTGNIVTVQYGPWQWRGVVTKFSGNPENAWYVPYSIEIEPMEDTSGHTAMATVVPTPEVRLSATMQDVQSRATTQSSPLQTAVPAVLPQTTTTLTDIQTALYGAGGQIADIPAAQAASLQTEIAATIAALSIVTSGGPYPTGATGGVVPQGVPLYYRVAPIIGGLEQPASPTTSIVLTTTQTATSLAWQPVTNATAYRVYRSLIPLGGRTYYMYITTTSFTDFGFSANTGSPILMPQLTMLSSGSQVAEAQALIDRLSLIAAILQNATPPLAVLAVVNPNLPALASAYYGDASQWPRIAAQNGLLDPQPIGTFTALEVPH